MGFTLTFNLPNVERKKPPTSFQIRKVRIVFKIMSLADVVRIFSANLNGYRKLNFEKFNLKNALHLLRISKFRSRTCKIISKVRQSFFTQLGFLNYIPYSREQKHMLFRKSEIFLLKSRLLTCPKIFFRNKTFFVFKDDELKFSAYYFFGIS